MEAPKCRTSGERHWSRVCADVTPAVTKPVTKRVTVTPTVTCAECDHLRAEVARLRRLLSEANGGRVAMMGAERVRSRRGSGHPECKQTDRSHQNFFIPNFSVSSLNCERAQLQRYMICSDTP